MPLVDYTLLAALAPAMHQITQGAGKAALGQAPSSPLPTAILMRAKTGFNVPTGAWMAMAADEVLGSTRSGPENKGLVSRRWSSTVLSGLAKREDRAKVHAA